MKQKPAVVVFDLGKVLVDFDYSLAVNRIAARCHGNGCDLWQVVSPAAKLLFDYETGLLTTEEFFAAVQKTAGYQGSLAEFSSSFAEIFSEIKPMIAFNERLRAQGIPTYIFSNTNPLAIEHIREKFPFFANFTDYVLSYEERSMKPESKIYESVEKRTGKKGVDILYIDDRAENVEAGAQRGWRAIMHESPEKTLGQIE